MGADISCTVTALVPDLTVNYIQNNLMYRFLYVWECVDMCSDLRILRRHYIRYAARRIQQYDNVSTSTGAIAVLCSAVQCCAVLCSAVQCCAVLCSADYLKNTVNACRSALKCAYTCTRMYVSLAYPSTALRTVHVHVRVE